MSKAKWADVCSCMWEILCMQCIRCMECGHCKVDAKGSTCEGLLQLLLAGGSFQQPSDEYNDMLKPGPLAGILTPALLQREQHRPL